MIIIRIANINIRINNKYNYLERLCKDYIINNNSFFDFEISISDNELDEEKNKTESSFSLGYIEGLCCYRKICLQLPTYNAFLMHAAVVSVDGKAYAFSAKSGTGKTTHTKLWKELLGDKMTYINGDKPIIRLINNKPIAFGTPWCGKESYGTNSSSELVSLCFIERSIENKIIILNKKDVLSRIIHQILIPNDEENASLTFSLLNQTINIISTYVLKCNMNIDAAVLSYSTMSK